MSKVEENVSVLEVMKGDHTGNELFTGLRVFDFDFIR
jgi:hypothetical protein